MCLAVNNSWNALNPCIQKDDELSSTGMDDRLTGLPNDVLLLILSFLTTKEVRRTSVISKKWTRWLLGYYPKLNFENSRVMKNIRDDYLDKMIRDDYLAKKEGMLAKEQSSFVTWVEHMLKQYLDSTIDEFRVAFDLDNSWESYVDRWVDFALTKRVKTLELDFQPAATRSAGSQCGLTLGYSKSLATLSLKYVNINSEVVENILLFLPSLENLTITKAEFLTSIRAGISLLSLKHLDISHCAKLQTIDVSAPKMVFFRYLGKPIELNIQNAVSLSSLFIGERQREEITYAFEPMSKYLPQLEALYLQMSLVSFQNRKCNIGIEHLQLPLLTTLKILELHIIGCHSKSLLGWIPLIEACPVLEKLTAKFDCYDSGINWETLTKRSCTPLKSIKTLEIFGYRGCRVDIEFAATIFKNAVNLQEVFVEVDTCFYGVRREPARVSELKEMVPEGVNFVLI